jgi:hypothetical protein
MSRPVLPKELVKLHADLPRKSMRRLTKSLPYLSLIWVPVSTEKNL